MRASRVIAALAVPLTVLIAACSSGSGSGGSSPASSYAYSGASNDVTPSSSTPSLTVPPAPPAKITGWKSVPTKRGVAYDVPPDWAVASSGVLVGWEDKDGPFFVMSGAAQLDDGYCPTNSGGLRGETGVKAGGDGTPEQLARIVASYATRIYTDEDSGDKPTVSTVVRSTTLLGSSAAIATATVTNIHTTLACQAKQAIFTSVALAPPGKPSVVLVIALYQGIPGSGDPAQIPTIISSLRALN